MSFPSIEAAISDGRIPESSRGEYEALMHRQPRQTKKFLARLPSVLRVDAEGDDLSADAEYPTVALTPGERRAIAASRNPRQPVHAPQVARSSPVRAQVPRKQPNKGPAYPSEWLTPSERAAISAERPTGRGNISFDVGVSAR